MGCIDNNEEKARGCRKEKASRMFSNSKSAPKTVNVNSLLSYMGPG